jgi:hypothetical protein
MGSCLRKKHLHENRGPAYISNIFHYYTNNMGTNPSKEKMPNRGMGREMGKDDDDESQDVNVQEIGTDPQIPGPGTNPQRGLGTNFTHVKDTSKTVKDHDE